MRQKDKSRVKCERVSKRIISYHPLHLLGSL